MTRRDRVLRTLNFENTAAMDLGGMLSTGISCFAYPKVVEVLGLPPRLPKVHDPVQMLALPDRDVLDALDCDVVSVHTDQWTNAFDEPERWSPYDFNGRLPALLQSPHLFRSGSDDSILYTHPRGEYRMVPESHVFDEMHGGESLDLFTIDPPKEDLTVLKADLESSLYTDARIRSIRDYCKRVRDSTDRAVLFNGLSMGLRFRGGMANWSIFCLTEPDHVHEVHGLLTEYTKKNMDLLIPEIAPYIDIFMANSDDQGTQNAPILPPSSFRELYVPYYREMNDTLHTHAPHCKSFLHSCGAIYPLLESVMEAGFDILNPVQWSAGGHSYREWKDVCRKRLVLWGGGINSQSTLPLGTQEEIVSEIKAVCEYLKVDGGFVFASIHNILAEIAPERVITLYKTASKVLRR